jgi:hypothetical protein
MSVFSRFNFQNSDDRKRQIHCAFITARRYAKNSTASIEHGATACAPMKMHARLVVWRFYFIPQFVGDTELAGGWLLNGKRNYGVLDMLRHTVLQYWLLAG